ncbi:MAG: hypothetical protein ABI863_08165 [Ginsengibacter sp.]
MRPSSLFLAYLLLFGFAVIGPSCQKEYSYEGGPTTGIAGGTAVYTLEGDGGNCTGPLINGTYTTGTALQSSNNIQLRVSVTTIGTYTLSTSLLNGIQFSTSGNFTVTGTQNITLTGSGTPINTGVVPFIPPVGSGCTFLVTVTKPGPQIARFTLEGDPDTCSNFKVNGTYTAGVVLTGANTVEVMVNVTGIGSYSITTGTNDGISFSQSGNFTTTGIQKVALTGSGSPPSPNILTFTPTGANSACTFGLTVLTPGPPATYVLESDVDSTCTGYSISGDFFAGTPLTHTNTMAVKVTVTVPGNFTISTNTVNDMTFSFTGNFNTLGSQIVVLVGSGTPVTSGFFTFTPQVIGPHAIGGEICSAYVTVM